MYIPIFVILGIIGLIGLFIIIVLFLIFLERIIFLRQKKWRIKTRKLITTPLSSYLNGVNESKSLKRMETLISTNKRKQILIDKLTLAHHVFSGKYSQKAKYLYYRFKLDELSKKKLYGRRWHKIVEGIVELTIMENHDIKDRLIALATHRNIEVRRQAKIGLIRVEKTDGLKDLFLVKDKLSTWSYVTIVSILTREPQKPTSEHLSQYIDPKDSRAVLLHQHLSKYAVISQ